MSSQLQRFKARISSCMLVLAAGLLLAAPVAVLSQPATGSPIPNSSQYFRLVRLAHGSKNGTIVASNGATGNIFQSTNNGNSWKQIATVSIVAGATLNGGATLFEMPQTVGSLAAGTLLFATTYTEGTQRAIEMYVSTNEGITWTHWQQLLVGGSTTAGLWEPEFEIESDGGLVVFWSDETDPCCSQKLAQMRTYDGTTWVNKQNTVASNTSGDRPGMAIVTKLPSGSYFMTYEICGGGNCTAFFRTSTDGWNFGTPSVLGTKIQTPSGQYFEHAPTNTWSPSVLSSNGAILVVGQVYLSSTGVDPQNGEVVLENLSSDGNSGNWYPISAPVQVPNAYDNFCPNYSSALLPATDGSSLLEVTSAYDSGGTCEGYFATESWNNLPANGSTHALRNVASNGLCVDDYGWGTVNDTEADLWTCTGSIIQEWTVHSQGSGYFSLSNADTGLCLDNTGGLSTPKNPTTLWGCANNSNQNWLFMDRGNAVYQLMNQASGSLMLDDWDASTTAGTQLEVFTSNGSPAQQYVLQ